MINYSKIRKFLFVLAVVCTISIGNAVADDPIGPGGNPGGEFGPVGAVAPIDGGAIFFLIAGAAYGLKKLNGRRKK